MSFEYSVIRAMKAQNEMKIPFAMHILPSRLKEIIQNNIIDNVNISHDGVLDDLFSDYEKLIPEDRQINIYDCSRKVYSALMGFDEE